MLKVDGILALAGLVKRGLLLEIKTIEIPVEGGEPIKLEGVKITVESQEEQGS